MGRELNRLSARKVQSLNEPGRYGDGGGLYLLVRPGPEKRWVLLYRHGGKRREMGLGPLQTVSLARARELAAEARQVLAGGADPIEVRRAPPADAAPRPTTFGDVATRYMADREPTWRNAVHRRQWRQTLEVQAANIWRMPVADVDTEAVLGALRPLWHEKPETARRLRGRLERVLDAARVAGHRQGENPARWRGHLDVLLPKAPRLSRGHHPALPYAEMPAFLIKLRARPALAARALEFLILTAARSGEVRGMTWGEVDLDAALWTVPRERMKAKRAHRVPLSTAALDLLRALPSGEPSAIVFPHASGGPLSDMVLLMLLRRIGQPDLTAHGFRSSFRDWAAEETDHPREVIEAALAHLVGDETERAYRRGDALAKRRHLMADWAAFCGSVASMKA